jgi:hypothetical protein
MTGCTPRAKCPGFPLTGGWMVSRTSVDAFYNNVFPRQESKHDSWNEKTAAQLLKPTEVSGLTFYKTTITIRLVIKIRKMA